VDGVPASSDRPRGRTLLVASLVGSAAVVIAIIVAFRYTQNEPAKLSREARLQSEQAAFQSQRAALCQQHGSVVDRTQMTLLERPRTPIEAYLVVEEGPDGYACASVQTPTTIRNVSTVKVLATRPRGEELFTTRATGERFAIPTTRCWNVSGIVDFKPLGDLATGQYWSEEAIAVGC
jgi:hypothetical protein